MSSTTSTPPVKKTSMDTRLDQTPAPLTRQAGRTVVNHLQRALADSVGVPVRSRYASDTDPYLRVWWSILRGTPAIEVCAHGDSAFRAQVTAAMHDITVTVGGVAYGFRPSARSGWEPVVRSIEPAVSSVGAGP